MQVNLRALRLARLLFLLSRQQVERHPSHRKEWKEQRAANEPGELRAPSLGARWAVACPHMSASARTKIQPIVADSSSPDIWEARSWQPIQIRTPMDSAWDPKGWTSTRRSPIAEASIPVPFVVSGQIPRRQPHCGKDQDGKQDSNDQPGHVHHSLHQGVSDDSTSTG